MEWFILWALIGIASGAVAHAKGQGGCGWAIGGLFLGPIAMFIVAFVPSNDIELTRRAVQTGGLRKCPYCAEHIKPEATKCRFCGTDVEPKLIVPPRAPPGAH